MTTIYLEAYCSNYPGQVAPRYVALQADAAFITELTQYAKLCVSNGLLEVKTDRILSRCPASWENRGLDTYFTAVVLDSSGLFWLRGTLDNDEGTAIETEQIDIEMLADSLADNPANLFFSHDARKLKRNLINWGVIASDQPSGEKGEIR